MDLFFALSSIPRVTKPIFSLLFLVMVELLGYKMDVDNLFSNILRALKERNVRERVKRTKEEIFKLQHAIC